MAESRRLMPPWAVFLLTWIGLVFIAAGVLAVVAGGQPDSVKRMEKAGEGAGKLGLIVGIAAYFVQRGRVKKREERDRILKAAEEHDRRVAAQVPCLRCGGPIGGSGKPWQEKSFCSPECMQA